MPLIDSIDQLYSATLTPKIDIASNPLGDIVARVHSSARTNYNRQITKHDALNAICYFLSLPHSISFIRSNADSNTSSLLTGSLLIRPCVSHLIDKAVDAVQLPPSETADIKFLAGLWFDTLRQSPDIKSLRRAPDIEQSPLFTFHLQAFNFAKASKQSEPTLFYAYGLQLHKDLRIEESQRQAAATHNSYALTARYFFKYLSPRYKLLQQHPPHVPTAYVDDFARQLDISLNGNSDGSLTDLAVAHKERLKRLLQHTPIRSHPHDSPSEDRLLSSTRKKRPKGISSEIPLDGTPHIQGTHDNVPNYSVRILDPVIDDSESLTPEETEVAEYEAIETKIYVDRDNSDVVPKKPSLQRLHDQVRLANYNFPWDSNSHNSFHYALIYSAIPFLWNRSAVDNAKIVFIELIIHMGIDPVMLINLTKEPAEPTDIRPALRDIDGVLHVVTKSIIKPMRAPKQGECLPVSDCVYAPVPNSIASRLREIIIGHGNPHVFSSLGQNGRLKRLSINDVDSYLADLVGRSFYRYNLRITVKSLCRSFFPLYSTKWGLDPLISILIRGSDFHRLYKTRLHYVHIPHSRLAQEYQAAYQRVATDIYSNLSASRDQGFIDVDDESIATIKEFLGLTAFPSDTNSAVPALPDLPLGYGSPIICSESYLHTLVTTLRQATDAAREVIIRHNLYICYSYLAMQFATALRPRNDPDICWHDIAPDLGLIAISDKQSAHFHEERFLGFPAVVRELIYGLRAGFPALQKYLAIHYCPAALSFMTPKIFSLNDQDTGQFKKFTLRSFKQILTTAGIDYQLPPNMPRHFARNYLERMNVPHEIAESWMGHHHHGKEIFGTASAASLAAVNKIIERHIEALLESLGFEPIIYLPRNIL